jgi:glucose-6-phosphate 1-dehydrogenase
MSFDLVCSGRTGDLTGRQLLLALARDGLAWAEQE